MDYAKKILGQKLEELLLHRKSLRKMCRRKDKGYNDLFNRWAKEATTNIKSLRSAINKLNIH